MGFIRKEVRGGTSHAHTTKEVLVSINELIQKKLAANDKSLKTIQTKMDGISSARASKVATECLKLN